MFCQQAIKNYNSFKDIVWHGTQYRLASPYETPVASLIYVNEDKSRAIMFTYLHGKTVMEPSFDVPIKLNGLDAGKKYKIREINIYPETISPVDTAQIYSGDFLMNVGFNPVVNPDRPSVVLEITEMK